jgi:hypothetical protein
MASCALLFMLWLGKFENANDAWRLGHFGWFMTCSEGCGYLNGWFTFDKDTNIDFGDRINYKEDMTNYFTVDKTYRELGKDDIEVAHGVCKLDGKRLKYQEFILDGKIK